MKLGELAPNPRNPRKITDKELERLKRALMEFGDLSGIVFNRRSQQLVGGHQRSKVIPKTAKIVIKKRYPAPTRTGTVAQGHVLIKGERYAYREVDWDEAKEKAAVIAANKHGGSWDYPALAEWLTDLDQFGVDFELTGFSHEEAVRLFAPEKLTPRSREESIAQPRPAQEAECPNCGEVFRPDPRKYRDKGLTHGEG